MKETMYRISIEMSRKPFASKDEDRDTTIIYVYKDVEGISEAKKLFVACQKRLREMRELLAQTTTGFVALDFGLDEGEEDIVLTRSEDVIEITADYEILK